MFGACIREGIWPGDMRGKGTIVDYSSCEVKFMHSWFKKLESLITHHLVVFGT